MSLLAGVQSLTSDLLSQHIWGQLLVFSSLHSQCTVDENHSPECLIIRSIAKVSREKQTSFNLNPFCVFECYRKYVFIMVLLSKMRTSQSILSVPHVDRGHTL